MACFLVFIGGGAGALSRYLSTQFINSIFKAQFTLGTVFVNCLGALFIGFLFGLVPADSKLKLLLITGFLGGYTTFSAYSLETAQYFVGGNIKFAIINVLVSNLLCIAFVFLGIWLRNLIFQK